MSAAVGGDTKNSLNNLGVGVHKAYAPTYEGLTNGQTAKTQAPGAQGTQSDVYWQWDASTKKWNGISKAEYDEAQSVVTVGASLGNLGGPGTIPAEGSGSLRYPSKDIGSQSHYALFQFFDYAPPFSKRNINEVAAQLAPQSIGAQGPAVPGVVNNGAMNGLIEWDTTGVTPGTYYYQCTVHSSMNGQINVQSSDQGSQADNTCQQGSPNLELRAVNERQDVIDSGGFVDHLNFTRRFEKSNQLYPRRKSIFIADT